MLNMLAIISPAKKLDFETESPVSDATDFRFAEEAQTLISLLRQHSTEDIKKLMKLSDALASLNAERYASWHPVMNEKNSKQALFAFKGDVYTGMSAETLTQDQITESQNKLRILSGLYGLLRPLDRIQPYRLEMGTKLATDQGKNLYQFWGTKLTDCLNQDVTQLKADVLINLASNEYFSAIQADKVQVPVITPVFKDEKNGEYKIRSFFAKKARGMMVRFILDESPQSEAALKRFNYGGYQFDAAESDSATWVFKRPEKV